MQGKMVVFRIAMTAAALACLVLLATTVSAQEGGAYGTLAPGLAEEHTPAPPPPAPEPTPAPAPAQEADPAPVLTGYSGGFFIQTPDEKFRLRLKGRVQGRFTFTSEEEHVGDDGDTNREAGYAFSIPRARFRMDGHAFSPDIKYVMQVEFGGGFTYLRDFYVDAGLVPGSLHLRVGQYKRPFSRQQLTSSGSQELVDRAITDRAFGAGRDLGVMLHNNFGGSPPFEWALGLFNGTGERPSYSGGTVTVDTETGEGTASGGRWGNVPRKFKPMVVARLGFNHGKLRGYSEADLEGGDLRFGMGASGKAAFNADDEDSSFVRAEIDYILKAHGFSTTGGFYVGSEQDDGGDFADQSFAALGAHVQAGYVIAGRVQPAVRYALVAPDGDDNNTHEIMGGIGVYIFGHNVKWQTDGGVLLREDPAGNLTDGRVRTQLQFGF